MRQFSLLIFLLVFADLYAAQDKPNFIFLLIDDMSPSAIGVYAREHGDVLVNTPHIDQLASEGMRFTDAYVTPQCTPTRASFLTGQYTARNRMWHVVPRYGIPTAYLQEPPYLENLPREAYTIGEALQDNGYVTAMMGKWHVNGWSLIEDNPDGYYNRLFKKAAHHHSGYGPLIGAYYSVAMYLNVCAIGRLDFACFEGWLLIPNRYKFVLQTRPVRGGVRPE